MKKYRVFTPYSDGSKHIIDVDAYSVRVKETGQICFYEKDFVTVIATFSITSYFVEVKN